MLKQRVVENASSTQGPHGHPGGRRGPWFTLLGFSGKKLSKQQVSKQAPVSNAPSYFADQPESGPRGAQVRLGYVSGSGASSSSTDYLGAAADND